MASRPWKTDATSPPPSRFLLRRSLEQLAVSTDPPECLYEKALTGAAATLKTSYDEGIAALKAEFGDKFEPMKEVASRLADSIFKTPEELQFYEQTGIGNHPLFLGPIMRLAPLAMQDSSFLAQEDRPGGEMTADAVRAEVADIMSNKDNKMHAGYWRQDRDVLRHIEELYRKAYGTKKVEA